MSRVVPAWKREKQAEIAKARETFLRTRVPTPKTTVTPRPMGKAGYKSILVKAGTTNLNLVVPISQRALDFFGGYANLELIDAKATTGGDGTATAAASLIRASKNFEPAKVHAMIGAAQPTAHTTSWGSRVIKYSASDSGTSQSHYVAPISSGDATPTQQEVEAKAKALLAQVKTKLGNFDYSQFYVTAEMYNVAYE